MVAWVIMHPGAVSSREQAQEEGLTAGKWRCQTTLWNGRAPSGSIAGGRVRVCWTTNFPREFCGINTPGDKIVGINL